MTSRDAGEPPLLKIGVIGALVAALCCFTPVLTILLTAVGAAALIGYLDYVLLPALVVFAVIIIVALERQRRTSRNQRGEER